MKKVVAKVVQKYQQSSCQQLWQEKMQKQGQPMPEMEERAARRCATIRKCDAPSSTE